MQLQWTPYLAVGVSKIDDQHIGLFRRFNNLYDALVAGEGKKHLADTLAFLEEYVIVHFRMEEEIMDRYSYRAASAHKAIHANFIRDMASFKERMQTSTYDTKLAVDVLTKLGEWLQNHVGGADQELGRFLRVAMTVHRAA